MRVHTKRECEEIESVNSSILSLDRRIKCDFSFFLKKYFVLKYIDVLFSLLHKAIKNKNSLPISDVFLLSISYQNFLILVVTIAPKQSPVYDDIHHLYFIDYCD